MINQALKGYPHAERSDLPGTPQQLSEPNNGLVVLIVEDELFVRLIAADTIEEAGHSVIEASNAHEALDLLEQRDDIDVLFSDIKMPGTIDGLALAATVRRRWPFMPIILTSGHLYTGDFELPAETAFLQKPYPASILLAELNRLSS